MLLRGIPEISSIAIIIQNAGIFLGVIFIYIGMMRFLDRKENPKIIFSVSTFFILAIVYFVYVDDSAFMRTMIFNASVAGISLLTAYVLFVTKMPSIATSAHFNAAIFLIHACFFSYRTVFFLSGVPVDDFLSPTLFNYSPFLDALIVSLLWTFGLIIMVNQRLNAENSETKENMELIFNTSPDAVSVSRLTDGNFVEVNERFTALTGYTSVEVIGKSSLDINLWKNQVERQQFVTALTEKGFCENLETVFQIKDGRQLTTMVSARMIVLQGVPHIISVTHDLTERKRAEEALRESERNLIASQRIAHLGSWRLDVATNQVVWTEELYKMYGFDPTVAPPPYTEHMKLFTPESWERLSNSLAKTRETGMPYELELETVRADGRNGWMWVRGEATKDSDGNIRGLWGAAQEITERKQVEEALRRQYNLLDELLKNLEIGVYMIDVPDGKPLLANDASFRLLGRGILPEANSNTISKVYDLYKSDSNEPYPNEELPLVVAMKGVSKHVEDMVVAQPDGTKINLEVFGSPIRDNEGNIWASLVTFQDITTRKQAEADKAELQAQNRQLQKTESLSRMAAAIAHHFNNQLGVVIGNLEMAIDEHPKGAPPDKSLTAAMQAAWKSADMSRLMLTYLGQSRDKREPLDISYCCRKILPILKAAIPANVILETDFSSPGPVINTNIDYMQQILTNLITNAWESIGKNSGTISLSIKTVSPAEIPTAQRHPIDWQPQDSAYACLEVTDTGCGVEDKHIEQLFDPFFTDKFTGRGMGLAVVQGLVKAHYGVVTVDSKPGRGSTFNVFFPLSEEALRQPQTVETKDNSLMSKVSPGKYEEGNTVLLIEDEEPLRKMIAIMLARLGFTVLEAKDGIEALEVFGKHQSEIKLVLTDLTMPRMDGWDTLTALRKLQPEIPVILASGYDLAHVMTGDHPELPQAFLAKPYNLKALSDAIRQALERENDE